MFYTFLKNLYNCDAQKNAVLCRNKNSLSGVDFKKATYALLSNMAPKPSLV